MADPQNGPPANSGSPWDEAKRVLNEPGGAELLVVLASALFLIDAFLPWYRVSVFRISGWSAGGWAVLAILSALGAGVFAAARLMGATVKIGTLSDGTILSGLGIAALGFTVLRLITALDFVSFGLFLAIALGAALVYGGMLKKRSEG